MADQIATPSILGNVARAFAGAGGAAQSRRLSAAADAKRRAFANSVLPEVENDPGLLDNEDVRDTLAPLFGGEKGISTLQKVIQSGADFNVQGQKALSLLPSVGVSPKDVEREASSRIVGPPEPGLKGEKSRTTQRDIISRDVAQEILPEAASRAGFNLSISGGGPSLSKSAPASKEIVAKAFDDMFLEIQRQNPNLSPETALIEAAQQFARTNGFAKAPAPVQRLMTRGLRVGEAGDVERLKQQIGLGFAGQKAFRTEIGRRAAQVAQPLSADEARAAAVADFAPTRDALGAAQGLLIASGQGDGIPPAPVAEPEGEGGGAPVGGGGGGGTLSPERPRFEAPDAPITGGDPNAFAGQTLDPTAPPLPAGQPAAGAGPIPGAPIPGSAPFDAQQPGAGAGVQTDVLGAGPPAALGSIEAATQEFFGAPEVTPGEAGQVAATIPTGSAAQPIVLGRNPSDNDLINAKAFDRVIVSQPDGTFAAMPRAIATQQNREFKNPQEIISERIANKMATKKTTQQQNAKIVRAAINDILRTSALELLVPSSGGFAGGLAQAAEAQTTNRARIFGLRKEGDTRAVALQFLGNVATPYVKALGDVGQITEPDKKQFDATVGAIAKGTASRQEATVLISKVLNLLDSLAQNPTMTKEETSTILNDPTPPNINFGRSTTVQRTKSGVPFRVIHNQR